MNRNSKSHAARPGDDPFRLSEPAAQIYEREGIDGLRRLDGAGSRVALAIRSLIETGKLPLVDRLRGEMDPVEILLSVPGIGRVHAERLHRNFGIETLEDLEAAAHYGRLGRIDGFGERRIAAIIRALRGLPGRARPVPAFAPEVAVAELLDVDREYRLAAAAGRLRKIASRRFNPNGDAWLPVLHTTRGARQYTALFSNTPQAHEQGKTADWVFIYCDGGAGVERQTTVTTAHQGMFDGERMVRGRETECAEYYKGSSVQAA